MRKVKDFSVVFLGGFFDFVRFLNIGGKKQGKKRQK
jgi:hypothetical protein